MSNKQPTGLSLKTRMIGTALLGTSIMVVVVYIIFVQTQNSFVESMNNERVALTELLAEKVDHEISMKIEGLKSIVEARESYLITPGSGAEERFLYQHMVIEEKYFNLGIFFLDADGNILELKHYREHRFDMDIARHLKREGMLEAGTPGIYTITVPGAESPIIAFLYPVSAAEEDVAEFAAGAIDASDILLRSAVSNYMRGKSGYTKIVDKDGLVIFSTRPELLLQRSRHLDLARFSRESGGAVIRDEAEGTVVAVAPLAETGWYLMVEQDAGEYYWQITNLRKTLLALVIVVSIMVTVFSVIISGTFVRPILSLSRGAERMAGGRLEMPIVEKGPGELSVLARSMEEMRNNLRTLLAREKQHKTELEREVNSKTERLRLLNEISLFLGQTLEIDEVINRTLNRTIELVGAHSGVIYLMEEDGETLRRVYTHHSVVPTTESVIKTDEGASGLAIKEGRAISIDTSQYSLDRLKKYFSREGIKTHTAVPLYSKGKLLGTLALASRREEVLPGEELDFLDSIASVVGSAIENALLFRQLSDAKAEWESTFDSITDLITIHDRDFNILRANRAVFEFFGLPPDKVIGQKCYKLFHNVTEGPPEFCPCTQLVEYPEYGRWYTAEIVTKGQDLKISAYPLKGEEELRGFVHVARSVTEEKKLLKDLEFRATSASVLNELTKAINSSLEIEAITSNLAQELEKIFKIDRIGFARFIPQEDAFGFKIYQDLTGRLTVGKEYIVKTKDAPSTDKRAWGEGVTYYCSDLKDSPEPFNRLLYGEGLNSYLVVPVVENGKTIAIIALGDRKERMFSEQEIAFLEDVADHLSVAMKNAQLYEGLEQAHKELKSMNRQLLQAEKLSSLGKLSAGTAHEILNPLTIISMHAQIMEMEGHLDEEKRQALSNIMIQVERIKKIAEGLRVFSRLHVSIEEVETDVNRLLEEALDLVAHDLKLNNIQVEKAFHPSLPGILADKNQLTQVFVNIMMNARDAMLQGGKLTIKTGINEVKNKRHIRIEFSDNGVGIPDEILSKIFDPFFTTKQEDQGTGLGLSICYGIVERMGGKIDVKSRVGEGTVFTVELPA